MSTSAITAFSLIAALSVAGCADEDRGSKEGPIAMADLGLVGESYKDVVPGDFQTEIARPDPGAPTEDGSEILATAEIDATEDRTMFPMPRGVQSFATHADLVSSVAEKFGATELIYDEKTGELVGARGSYTQRGTSFFEDEKIGARFEVTEPVLAYVGGVNGQVEVAGETICLDVDGGCDGERASYLNPVGEVTAPTHVPLCRNGVCVEYHSFYNRTWFPPYARHGSNIRFTTFSALPSTRYSVGGAIHVPPGGFDPSFWTTFPMPSISNQGQDSIETAVWCFGTTACVEYQATAVCGTGTVTDPDVSGTRRTGNGPANNARCPS